MTKRRNTKALPARVYLRAPRPDDFDELSKLYALSRAHFRGRARTAFDAETFRRQLADAELESNEFFLVCLAATDEILGTLNLSQIFGKGFQNAYLGYQLFAGNTGRGYMTEAVDLALRLAFTKLRLHRIEANVQPGNASSIAVLRRCGFAKEGFSRRYLKIGGRWRDHERWAIIREDWVQQKLNNACCRNKTIERTCTR